MPDIVRQCKITGREFKVSELEQQLRASFDVGLPNTHPYERMRRLMCFRNITTLYNDMCDLCGKHTLSMWGESPIFPVYCHSCWHSDVWQPKALDVDINQSFFDQFQALVREQPHPSLVLSHPIENSDYCNSATQVKNCYMIFNSTYCEDSYYCFASYGLKNCIDTHCTQKGELLYDCIACHGSYKVCSAEFAENCNESYFLYDCIDCNNCALSTGLRHKEYVFENQQLTKKAYEEKIMGFKSGSFQQWKRCAKQFNTLKKEYAKKCMIGSQNDQVEGNLIFNSKKLDNCFYSVACENCSNLCNVRESKDCLDVCMWGRNTENCYSCTAIGNESSDIRFSWTVYNNCSSLEYCAFLTQSNNSLGCAFGKNFEFAILNKKYSPNEYKEKLSQLKQKMIERGEYGEMFRNDLTPFAYNESVAQLFMPLSQEEARKLGYRWVDRANPYVDPTMLYTANDSILECDWECVKGKTLVCQASGRPYKITKQEFDFYKQYNIPLPRMHWEERLLARYPRDIIFNSHEASCIRCQRKLVTSMRDDDAVLCETCYQITIQ